MANIKRKKIHSSNQEPVSLVYFYFVYIRIKIKRIINNLRLKRQRSVHKSFVLTKRRDYIRKTDIGGCWAFTAKVWNMLWSNKKQFIKLALIIDLFFIILIGLMDQGFINSLRSVVDNTGGNLITGKWGEIGKAGLITVTILSSGGLMQSPSQAQQIIIFIIIMVAWLVIVQVCRNIYSKEPIRLKNILYTAGAPVVPMSIFAIIMLLQLIPAFIAVILFSASNITGALAEGVHQALFLSGMAVLIVLSLYWLITSIFGLIIITIPGMQPVKAFKIASDMIARRKIFVACRILFAVFILFLVWLFVAIPVVIVNDILISIFGFISELPVLQISMMFLATISMIFFACYLYSLYRSIMEYDQRK